MMPGVDFDSLLKNAMGLDAGSLGPTAIARAVKQRQAACQLDDVNGYWLLLRRSPAELQELIETVVVPETWFFRDRKAFVALADMARAELSLHPATTKKLRLLSLPCSSGEEPFSMAIALLDAGIAANRFRIDAIDISQRALERAGRACYGSNSFRGKELDFRVRHFLSAAGQWQLSDSVRRCVEFNRGNLLAADFLPGQGIYDFIFCRNVLIYFDRDTQARAVEVLLRLLSRRGALFVGPSETGLLPAQRLASSRLPMAFAFRRTGECTPAPVKAAPARKPVSRVVRIEAGRSNPPRALPPVAERRATVDTAGDQEAGFALVQLLANQGRLVEATAACEYNLSEHGPSARGYCLLGLIRDAAGETDAAAALYRKALYLEPQYQDALRHLVLLLDQQGNGKAARIMRERLQRLEAKAS